MRRVNTYLLGKKTQHANTKYVFHVANEKYFIHVLDTVLVEFKVNNKDIWTLSTDVVLVFLFVNFEHILWDIQHIYLVFLLIWRFKSIMKTFL